MLTHLLLNGFFTGATNTAPPSGFKGASTLPPYFMFDGFRDSGVIPTVTDSIPIATFNGGIRMLTEKQYKKRRKNSDYILLLLS